MRTESFALPRSWRLVAMTIWLATLTACPFATTSPRPKGHPDEPLTTREDGSATGEGKLQLAGDATAPPTPVAIATTAPAEPPLATKPARPVEVIADKPDSLVEDSCVACGGAVWRILFRDVSQSLQIQGDRLLLFEKPNGAPPKILVVNAKTGNVEWMRTLKGTEGSGSLYVQSLNFLAGGQIAVILEENRGGRANGKLVLLGIDGSKINEFDFDPSLSGLMSTPINDGLLVYGRRYSVPGDPVERFYLAYHDAKGRPVGAFYDEMGQVAGIVPLNKETVLCGLAYRSKKSSSLLEINAKTWSVLTKKDRQVDWLRPFLADGTLYYGILETPDDKEWKIRHVDPSGNEKTILKSRRSLSTEFGGKVFLVEYGGRDRRYFPLFSKSEEPAHILRGPEGAYLYLGPGGDAFSYYEGIVARWAAEKGPNGGTIAAMKLLTR